MLFRVVMVTTLLLIAIYVEMVSETLLRVNPLYFLVVATYALTLFHAFALRYTRYLAAQVYVQVVADLAIITGLVYVTGGSETRAGFVLLYPISVLSGSVILDRGKGLILAGIATVFYGAVLWAVRANLISPYGLVDVPFLPAKHLLYAAFVTGVACATVALIGGYLSESLKTAGERLVEAAEQMADLQELNKVIVDSIHSGLLTADAEGRVLYLNGFGASFLGRRPAEARGRPVAEVFGSRLLDVRALEARAAAHHGLARMEIPCQRPDGSRVELGVSVSRLETGDAGRGGFLLVFQDLTEIKRLEQEVRMKEKLAAVGEMAAHLAHEIRNPLGAISGSAQMLLGEADLSTDRQRLLGIITRESKRLSDALSQFLLQARPSPSERALIDIGPVVAGAVELLRNSSELGPQHRVEFEIDDGSHVCLADPDQISQVFWNLARNALEAMPEGGLLSISVASSASEVVLLVRDQGRGMGREQQQRLFVPFESGTRMGTGLGLAIVYRIVREHHGDISVRSYPSLGTEVAVRLPLVSVPASA
jgi:two-component system sensor histidine kinase PilS (NtrC family)